MSDLNPGRARKTLFVDDDELIRAIMVEVLLEYGHEVLEATTAAEALSLVDESVDLMITDIRLPDRLGNELAADVRKRFPRLPIIFATGGDGTFPSGSDTVDDAVMLLKPYDLATFKLALEKVGGLGG